MKTIILLFGILLAIAASAALAIIVTRYLVTVPTELKKIRLILQNGRDIPEDPKEKGPYDD